MRAATEEPEKTDPRTTTAIQPPWARGGGEVGAGDRDVDDEKTEKSETRSAFRRATISWMWAST
jgi:hypothetical protein